MKRPIRHYESIQTEIGRPLTSEEERILDMAETYISTESQEPVSSPPGPDPASKATPEK